MPPANREQRRQRARSQPKGAVIRITVDDKTYTLDVEAAMDELTGLDAAQVRKATGLSLRALFSAAQDDPDLDTISALVFLARRQDDPSVTFDEVITSIGYGTKLDFEDTKEAKPKGKGDAIEARVVGDDDPET
jgi:hypothetical protein